VSEDLPNGWTARRLRDVVTKLVDGSHNPPPKEERGVPMLSARNVEGGRILFDRFRWVSAAGFAIEHARTQIRPGDVLITIVGSIGRVAIVPEGSEPFCLQRSVAVLSPLGLLPEFLARQLESPRIQTLLEEVASGTAQKGIYLRTLAELEVHVPPLPEQKRIVEKLDSLLEDVNRARARLANVPLILKRFRQSVLAAACSGTLTEDWRADHSVAHLPRLDVELEGLPQLPACPAEWGLGPLEAFTRRFQYGTNDKADADARTGIPVLRMGNIQNGALDLSDLKYVRNAAALDPFLVEDGDVLFNRTNSPELVGKAAIVASPVRMVFASYLIRAQVDQTRLRPTFVSWWLNSGWGRSWARHVRTDGVSQSNINATKLSQMPIPLPSIDEQDEAIRRGAALLAMVETIEGRVRAATAGALTLPQAILSKAFSGELVPTEAQLARAAGHEFEPAPVLRDRVHAHETDEAKATIARRQSERLAHRRPQGRGNNA